MRTVWKKSSRSGAGAGNVCVETRANNNLFQFRDSKLSGASPILSTRSHDYSALLSSLK